MTKKKITLKNQTFMKMVLPRYVFSLQKISFRITLQSNLIQGQNVIKNLNRIRFSISCLYKKNTTVSVPQHRLGLFANSDLGYQLLRENLEKSAEISHFPPQNRNTLSAPLQQSSREQIKQPDPRVSEPFKVLIFEQNYPKKYRYIAQNRTLS